MDELTRQLDEHTAIQRSQVEGGLPYHSLEDANGILIPGLIPVEQLRQRFTELGVPEDLRGKTVLDIGAASGWNTFECLRRGATVVALDYVAYDEFIEVNKTFSSPARYVIADVEQVDLGTLGSFDVVLFCGVLYHLRNPVLALERVCAAATGVAYIESFVFDGLSAAPASDSGTLWCQFYPGSELAGQLDNWWGPSAAALISMCRSAGFTDVDARYTRDFRLGLRCSRAIEPGTGSAPSPIRIAGISSNRGDRDWVHAGADEYVIVYFDSSEFVDPGALTVRVDESSVPVISFHQTGEKAFQLSFRVPSWAGAGEHAVSLRLGRSGWSNSLRFEVHTSEVTIQAEHLQASPMATATAAVDLQRLRQAELVELEARIQYRSVYGSFLLVDLVLYVRNGGVSDSGVQVLVDGNSYRPTRTARTAGDLLQLKLARVRVPGTTRELRVGAMDPQGGWATPIRTQKL